MSFCGAHAGCLARVVADELGQFFEDHRSEQHQRTLTFSAMAMAVAEVVPRLSANFRQAYAMYTEDLGVSLASFYNKINATELQTSEAIVARSAQRAGDSLMADRHYCILRVLFAAEAKGVCFLIRQHGRFKGVLVGKRRKMGRTATGTVNEQVIKTCEAADALGMHRITMEADEPTRDGDTVIRRLTNLPANVSGLTIAGICWKQLRIGNACDLADPLREFSRPIDLSRYRKSCGGLKRKIVKPPARTQQNSRVDR